MSNNCAKNALKSFLLTSCTAPCCRTGVLQQAVVQKCPGRHWTWHSQEHSEYSAEFVALGTPGATAGTRPQLPPAVDADGTDKSKSSVLLVLAVRSGTDGTIPLISAMANTKSQCNNCNYLQMQQSVDIKIINVYFKFAYHV